MRWLRAEYPTKTEARQALPVRSIIDDADVYDTFKLLSGFVRVAGYAGLLVVFDEMVNLYKLQSSQARNQNYEQILRILNDVLQGNVEGLGFVFGGTPEFLLDSRRGLYSDQALQSRLAENSFATEGRIDLSGPVLRLQSLSPEDLLILLSNIRSVFALENPAGFLVPGEALTAFMDHCNRRIGEAYFRTPCNTIKAFVQFLAGARAESRYGLARAARRCRSGARGAGGGRVGRRACRPPHLTCPPSTASIPRSAAGSASRNGPGCARYRTSRYGRS